MKCKYIVVKRTVLEVVVNIDFDKGLETKRNVIYQAGELLEIPINGVPTLRLRDRTVRVSQEFYPELFKVIGFRFGWKFLDTSKSFYLPQLAQTDPLWTNHYA